MTDTDNVGWQRWREDHPAIDINRAVNGGADRIEAMASAMYWLEHGDGVRAGMKRAWAVQDGTTKEIYINLAKAALDALAEMSSPEKVMFIPRPCCDSTREALRGFVASHRKQMEVMREALKPFARVAGSDTIRDTAALGMVMPVTVTNGKRMVCVAAQAFIDAADALAKLEGAV